MSSRVGEFLFGWIVFDGADSERIYYHTKSWTRPSDGITHDIWIDKETGMIYCSCEDATCRKKAGHAMDEEPNESACKHVRALQKMIVRHIGLVKGGSR